MWSRPEFWTSTCLEAGALLAAATLDISPDGRWIVFDLLGHIYRVPAEGGDRGGQDNLWVTDADGSNPRAIHLSVEYRLQEPEWTPDGRKIAVTRKLKGPVGFYRATDVISIFPAEGRPPTDLVVLGASGATAPARSGFWKGADRAQNPSFTPDGRTLFFGSAIADDDFAVHFARTPVTSPDGRHVVFEAAGWLWIEEGGEGGPRRLTDASGYLTAAV